ncbi:uncharacterized protein C12orf40 homolog isoform X2 [Hyla sarda]|uniref:uncharacterized protein C12orf40 homolog isoform X2 n=2 Tax=Hyla sarda TaxID=327740 RepID=UPI0024C28AFD|nr:uncharacterized protein C12orf40 homolog isoform X2 [Hyla sarda]
MLSGAPVPHPLRSHSLRSRMVLKQERQKQREFFQKKKMKSKLKLLESSYPTQASLSLDVLNLHIINQISKKKERSKHLDMGERNETFSNLRKNVQLPMSPINIPSKLCLDDPEAISLQAEAFECRTDQNLQSITKQELIFEEKFDMTTEAKRRDAIQSESNVKQIRQELKQRFQHCLHDKCTSGNNGIILSAEKLPVQCSASHLTTLSMFEMQENLSLSVRKLNPSGKQDVSVQCNFEQEQKFIGCVGNTEAVNLPNNTAFVEATRGQN